MMKPGSPPAHPGTESQDGAAGGIACPKCGSHIPMTIAAVLIERRFVCPGPACTGVLTLDSNRSSEALSLLKAFSDRRKRA